MSCRGKALLSVAALAVALPAAAQAPAPSTAFDGRYVGVSRESSKAGSNPGAKCLPNGVPAPLAIRNEGHRNARERGLAGNGRPAG
jgi:hypothetical protein